MNKSRLLLTGLLALVFLATSLHAAPSTIEVTFTNHSGYEVAFFLNGGEGMEGRIKDKASTTYTMTVDKGVAPEIKIHQVKGPDQVFSVKDKGRYVLKMEDGKIVNSYE